MGLSRKTTVPSVITEAGFSSLSVYIEGRIVKWRDGDSITLQVLKCLGFAAHSITG